MPAGDYDLVIEQGATFELHVVYETGNPAAPVNLTGWTGRLQVRLSYKDPVALMDLSTANGAITLGSAGQIDVVGSATLTNVLPAPKMCVYDLEITNGTVVRRVLEGNAAISPQVTR